MIFYTFLAILLASLLVGVAAQAYRSNLRKRWLARYDRLRDGYQDALDAAVDANDRNSMLSYDDWMAPISDTGDRWYGRKFTDRPSSDVPDISVWGYSIAIVAFIAIAIMGVVVSTTSLGQAGSLNATVNNVEHFDAAIVQSEALMSDQGGVLIAGSIERQQVATEVSIRIAERRDLVAGYNRGLKSYEVGEQLFGFLWLGTIDDLKPYRQ